MMFRSASVALALLLGTRGLEANMYDVIMPTYLPPEGCDACRPWDATEDAALWAKPEALASAGTHCAMPAANLTGIDKTSPLGSCTDSGSKSTGKVLAHFAAQASSLSPALMSSAVQLMVRSNRAVNSWVGQRQQADVSINKKGVRGQTLG